MSRSVKAVTIAILGCALVCLGAWLRDYLYPEVIFLREDRLALVLGLYINRIELELENSSAQVPGGNPLHVAICVERRYPTPWREREYVQAFSYFRALAKPWDPRGALLDHSWPKAAVRRFANGVVFNLDLLEAAFNSHSPTVEQDIKSTFFPDCASAPKTPDWAWVKLVAVSPAIRSPYGIRDEILSCFGFFVAVELVYPDGRSKRSVGYYPSYVISAGPVEAWDGHITPMEEIPETYWENDFGAWKSIVDYANKMPPSKRRWWFNTVLPWPHGY